MSTTPDVIDTVLGLSEGSDVWSLRRRRPAVLAALQQSYEAIFGVDATANGVTSAERAACAAAICRAAGAGALAIHYEGLGPFGADPDPRPELVRWAVRVAVDPQSSRADHVTEVRDAGLADAEIITLAQLIGFVSTQLRVVVGLEMMEI